MLMGSCEAHYFNSSTWKFSNKIIAEHTRKGSAIILQPLASFTTRDLDFSIIKTAYY